jgi:hypothetical protein
MKWKIGGMFAVVLAVCMPSYAGTDFTGTSIPIPAGLAEGDSFQFVFVTSNSYSATSMSLGTYDADVAGDASQTGSLVSGLTITWSLLGSTSGGTALNNIFYTSPATDNFAGIYNLAGQQVADGTETTGSGLYSGALINAISVTDFGVPVSLDVWTAPRPMRPRIAP